MSKETEPRLPKSSMYEFLERGWQREFINLRTLRVKTELMYLLVLWAFDSIRRWGKDMDESFYDSMYYQISCFFYDQQGDLNSDLKYIRNFIFAFALCCLGRLLSKSMHVSDIYSRIMNVIRLNRDEILHVVNDLNKIECSQAVRDWCLKYFDEYNQIYFTHEEKVEWANEEMRALAVTKPAMGIHNYNIENFINHGTVNDYSTTIQKSE